MSDKLQDIEDIRQLKYRYFRCLDTANIEELAELFTEDAAIHLEGGNYLFEAEGRDKICEIIRNAFHTKVFSFHHGNHPEIEIVSDDAATGLWYLRDWYVDLSLKTSTNGTAFYRDRYVKQDGRWLVRHSSYTRVWEIVEEVTKPPNLTAHYLARHSKTLPPEGSA